MKVLLRGRRWGKTVLGDAWLAFLSGEAHPFKGTAVAKINSLVLNLILRRLLLWVL